MELRERVAIAISGAPFPSNASLRKADAAIAAVFDALREPSEGMVDAGQEADGTITAERVWQAMLDAFARENGLPADSR